MAQGGLTWPLILPLCSKHPATPTAPLSWVRLVYHWPVLFSFTPTAPLPHWMQIAGTVDQSGSMLCEDVADKGYALWVCAQR